MKNHKDIFLQFDFKTDGSNTGPLLFSDPDDIITTDDLADVEQCLMKVESAVNSGLYAAGYASYETIYALQKEIYSEFENRMPLLWFGIFKEPLNNQVAAQDGIFNIGEWKMEETKQHYKASFHQIMTAIKQGKTDEINYTVS